MKKDEIWDAKVQKARGIRPTCLLAQRTDLLQLQSTRRTVYLMIPVAIFTSLMGKSCDLSSSFNSPWEPSDFILAAATAVQEPNERNLTPPVVVTATEAVSTTMERPRRGCSVTMSPDIILFTRLREMDPVHIVAADGEIMAYQAGPMRFRTKNQAGQLFTYENCFGNFVPGRNSGRRMEFRFENAIISVNQAPGTVSGLILALQVDNTAGLNKSLDVQIWPRQRYERI